MMKFSRFVMGSVLASAFLLASAGWADEAKVSAAPIAQGTDDRAIGLAACAALAISLSVLGAAYAVGRIGSAALGAAAEKPELLTRSIVFVALAEGLAVLGFAIAMMLLQKI